MAWVEKRERTTAKGKTQITWRVRWREPDGKARAKSFPRKVDADRFAFTVSADIVRGNYLDPDAGKVLFEEYAGKWLAAQTFEETTRVAVELRLRLHAFPTLGHRFLSDIQPSTIQGWLRGLTDLAPTYRKVVFANVATVFTAAVDDGLLPKNPCKAPSVRKPKSDPKKLVPWTQQRVLAMRDELPDRYSLVVVLGAGLGLRQGEIFALSPDDLDLERSEVNVRRQVKVFGGNLLVFGLPKGRKTRKVPLPNGVLEAVTRHMTQYPPLDVTLPWMVPDGKETTASLLLTTREKKALNRNYFNTYLWRPALVRAKIPDLRENGCHALRHFFASTALHEGETIKAVSEYLGHADPGFTLRTYTHLMEGSSERTKRAIDAVFGTHPETEEDVDEDDDEEDTADGEDRVASHDFVDDSEDETPQMTWKVASERYNPSMRSKDALRVLAEITAYQWGMVTSAQASMHGVTRLDLSRLAADGLLERLAHGVYKTTSTPSNDLDRLRAAWLSTDPKRLAHQRRTTDPDAVVFAGASAARIHGIGDLWDEHFDFITPMRRQSQRGEVRYRKRVLDPRDVTTLDGLPVLSVEATIADLVEVVGDLSLVADALRDAWRRGDLDTARLADLLDPATLTRLTELADARQGVARG